MNEFDYLYENHLQTDAEEPKEKLITVQLNELEISMIIGALDKTYRDHKLPNKTDRCKATAYKYKDLSKKLYNILTDFHLEND